MIRGIGKQILFEDDKDRLRFIDSLEKYKAEESILLHAFCLMENHVHLLVQDTCGKLDLFMKKLEGSYAFYYNRKYERTGTLFQERYKSEPVDSDPYYMSVLRYIIRNPEKRASAPITHTRGVLIETILEMQEQRIRALRWSCLAG